MNDAITNWALNLHLVQISIQWLVFTPTDIQLLKTLTVLLLLFMTAVLISVIVLIISVSLIAGALCWLIEQYERKISAKHTRVHSPVQSYRRI